MLKVSPISCLQQEAGSQKLPDWENNSIFKTQKNPIVTFFHGHDNQNSIATVIKPAQVYSNSRKDISILQIRDSSSGIPQYIVRIVNACVSGYAPSDIHLHCGWFASARIVNPRIFERLFYNDCLVNGGKPLKTNQIIRFTYSNSLMYPLAFKSAKFCW
ncbi:hypothetical protein PVL29_019697 [Vitis rotundifolia]|uniref:Uncharacterized protein n=1 Tax=Vitis rotundifolia TaxID=103349 RepID=A0AA38Z143_VITRO|nr:hypothetical protein PVL29_019697 [Vitis rotundifolia]